MLALELINALEEAEDTATVVVDASALPPSSSLRVSWVDRVEHDEEAEQVTLILANPLEG